MCDLHWFCILIEIQMTVVADLCWYQFLHIYCMHIKVDSRPCELGLAGMLVVLFHPTVVVSFFQWTQLHYITWILICCRTYVLKYIFIGLCRTWQFSNAEKETVAENRCVYLVATDGDGLYGLGNVTVAVTFVNDETPQVSLPYASIDFAEDSLFLNLFEHPAMVSILDDDDNTQFLMEMANATLRHATSTEWLMFDSSSSGLGNVINGTFDYYTAVLTLMGPATVGQFEVVSIII